MSILEILASALLGCLPILLWAYVFSYFDGVEFRIHRFIFGWIAGAISVLPIVYASRIYDFIGMNGFLQVLGNGTYSLWEFLQAYLAGIFLPFSAFFAVLVCLSGAILWQAKKRIGLSMVGFFFLSLCLGIVLAYVPPIGSGDLSIQDVHIGAFTSICIVYVFVASLEEAMKHVGSYGSFWVRVEQKEVLLFAVYSALGFVFLENLLYLTNIAEHSGILSASFFGTLASRSIVSLLLHVFASLIIALGFLRYATLPNIRTGIQFAWAFLLAVGVHAVFNISLSYGKAGIIALYAFVGYFFFTKVFFDERSESQSLEPAHSL